MNESFTHILATITLITHVVIVLYIIGRLIFKDLFSRVEQFVGRHSILIAFIISTVGSLGSLIYSEVINFEPCVLCWVQRAFLYPQVIIYFLAVWKKDYSVWFYALPLTVIGGLVALYHSYTQIGGISLTPCTSDGGACSKIFFLEYGYITIPTMAATAFILLFITLLHMKRYSKQTM